MKKGDILVCLKTQRYGCGSKKILEGAIVKYVNSYDLPLNNEDYITIETAGGTRYDIENSDLRLATPKERDLYHHGVKYIPVC